MVFVKKDCAGIGYAGVGGIGGTLYQECVHIEPEAILQNASLASGT